jgi:hypothetical protein
MLRDHIVETKALYIIVTILLCIFTITDRQPIYVLCIFLASVHLRPLH